MKFQFQGNSCEYMAVFVGSNSNLKGRRGNPGLIAHYERICYDDARNAILVMVHDMTKVVQYILRSNQLVRYFPLFIHLCVSFICV